MHRGWGTEVIGPGRGGAKFREGTEVSGDPRAGTGCVGVGVAQGCVGYGDDGGSPGVQGGWGGGRHGWSHAVQVDGMVLYEDLIASGTGVQ